MNQTSVNRLNTFPNLCHSIPPGAQVQEGLYDSGFGKEKKRKKKDVPEEHQKRACYLNHCTIGNLPVG